jgi:hypothetical protein
LFTLLMVLRVPCDTTSSCLKAFSIMHHRFTFWISHWAAFAFLPALHLRDIFT